MDARVSFLIPNYNGARFLAETLRSLLAQTEPDFQLILLDNCSTDNSIELAGSFADPRLRIIRADTHVSMTENWNRALDLARTPYFVLAHADDVYEPEYLETMLRLLAGRPRAFMAHCKALTIDEAGRARQAPAELYKDTYWPVEDPCERPLAEEFDQLRKGNFIIASSVMLRQSAVAEIGAFNERYQFVPDWEYWCRGLLAGYTIAGTHRRLVRYRRHGHSDTSKHDASLRSYREEIALLEWAAARAQEVSPALDARPYYKLVWNILLSEFARRLAAGDRAGARGLRDFARAELPGFTRSARDSLMSGALAAGQTGGHLLRAAESAYLYLRTRHLTH